MHICAKIKGTMEGKGSINKLDRRIQMHNWQKIRMRIQQFSAFPMPRCAGSPAEPFELTLGLETVSTIGLAFWL